MIFCKKDRIYLSLVSISYQKMFAVYKIKREDLSFGDKKYHMASAALLDELIGHTQDGTPKVKFPDTFYVNMTLDEETSTTDDTNGIRYYNTIEELNNGETPFLSMGWSDPCFVVFYKLFQVIGEKIENNEL